MKRSHSGLGRAVVWMVAAACTALGAQACADSFTSCKSTETCAGGAGGNAGAGGTDAGGGASGGTGIAVDAPCDTNGALACAGPAEKLGLICRQGTWQPNVTCAANENCDQSDGACASIVAECADRQPGEAFCDADTLVTCGPDLVTADHMACEGTCDATVGPAACVAPACPDGKVEAPEQCDDSNALGGDGCSATCKWEVRALAAGSTHTCALFGNGAVKCWGSNVYGQLGLGDVDNRGDGAGEMGLALPTVDLGAGRTAKAITAGGGHTCAILDDDSVKCWGNNVAGQLGLGDTDYRGDQPGEMGDALPTVDLGTGRIATAITAGDTFTCALLDNSALKCWGVNAAGELGQGDTESRGDQPGELGDGLLGVRFPGTAYATTLSLGFAHACAVLDSGALACWGANASGQLGIGSTLAQGDEPNEMTSTNILVNLGTDRVASSIAASRSNFYYQDPYGTGPFTCAIRDDGSLRCWGWLANIGFGSTYIGGQTSEMGDALPAYSLGVGRTAVAVAAGSLHVCVILDDGSVHCWGRNELGQVGHTAVLSNETPPAVPLGAGRKALSITAGYSHTCVILDDQSVKCWGLNQSGQLGQGDVNNRGLTSAELGDALEPVDLRL